MSSLKLVHVPLLLVYFAVGLGGLAAVSIQLFTNNIMTLDAKTIAGLTVWIMLAWSLKPVFGQIVDYFKMRRSGILIGQIIFIVGNLFYVDMAWNNSLNFLGEYTQLLIGGTLVNIGIVLSDIVADVMAIELAENHEELGMLQAYSRAALMAGALIGAISSGFLADSLEIYQVFLIETSIAVFVILLTLLLPVRATKIKSPINKKILAISASLGVVAILSGLFMGNFGQLFTAIVGGLLLVVAIKILTDKWDKQAKTEFYWAMAAIFLLRVTPGIGPAGTWWYQNSLEFSAKFLGYLQIGGTAAGLLAALLLAKIISKASIQTSLTVITALLILLGIPELLIYYNLTGLPDKYLAFFDTSMTVPLANLAMIPLGIIIGKAAPKEELGTYTTVTAGLMNMALLWGNVIEQQVNSVFTVTRDDFSQLGYLMVTTLVISTVLSILGLLFLKGVKK